MTVSRARDRADRDRRRRWLPGAPPMLRYDRRVNRAGWRTETYGPIPGTGTFRDPRFYDRTARWSR